MVANALKADLGADLLSRFGSDPVPGSEVVCISSTQHLAAAHGHEHLLAPSSSGSCTIARLSVIEALGISERLPPLRGGGVDEQRDAFSVRDQAGNDS